MGDRFYRSLQGKYSPGRAGRTRGADRWDGPRSIGLAGCCLGDVSLVWPFVFRSGYPIGLAVVPKSAVVDRLVPNRVTWEVWSMLKKSQFAASSTPALPGWEPDEIAAAHPTLWAFLTQDTWDDGSSRETGSMLLFADQGQLKCMLRDKANNACLWIAGASISQLLDVAEVKIVEVGADWRRDRYVAPAEAAKKKRK